MVGVFGYLVWRYLRNGLAYSNGWIRRENEPVHYWTAILRSG
jgi:hypothetical protein